MLPFEHLHIVSLLNYAIQQVYKRSLYILQPIIKYLPLNYHHSHFIGRPL